MTATDTKKSTQIRLGFDTFEPASDDDVGDLEGGMRRLCANIGITANDALGLLRRYAAALLVPTAAQGTEHVTSLPAEELQRHVLAVLEERHDEFDHGHRRYVPASADEITELINIRLTGRIVGPIEKVTVLDALHCLEVQNRVKWEWNGERSRWTYVYVPQPTDEHVPDFVILGKTEELQRRVLNVLVWQYDIIDDQVVYAGVEADFLVKKVNDGLLAPVAPICKSSVLVALDELEKQGKVKYEWNDVAEVGLYTCVPPVDRIRVTTSDPEPVEQPSKKEVRGFTIPIGTKKSAVGAAEVESTNPRRERLLSLLTPRQREIVTLFVSPRCDLDYRVTADRLDDNYGTVYSHVKHAIKRLREQTGLPIHTNFDLQQYLTDDGELDGDAKTCDRELTDDEEFVIDILKKDAITSDDPGYTFAAIAGGINFRRARHRCVGGYKYVPVGRRELSRILKTLVDDGFIRCVKRGVYTIADEPKRPAGPAPTYKFKVGDRVAATRRFFDGDHPEVGWDAEMITFLGVTGVISDLFDDGSAYVHYADRRASWFWPLDVLRPVQVLTDDELVAVLGKFNVGADIGDLAWQINGDRQLRCLEHNQARRPCDPEAVWDPVTKRDIRNVLRRLIRKGLVWCPSRGVYELE